jgi:hypothetical protein
MKTENKLIRFIKGIIPGKKSSKNTEKATNIFGEDVIIHTVLVDNVKSILTICQKDYSKPGYSAAKKVADMAYAQQVLKAIKGKLLNYVKLVERKYNEEIKEAEEKLKHFEKENYNDMANAILNKLEQLKLEVDQLMQIKVEIIDETENGVFMQIRESFLAGFREGIVEYHNLKSIEKNL